MYPNFLPTTFKPYAALVKISPNTKIRVYETIRTLQSNFYCNLTAILHINRFFRARFSVRALMPDEATMYKGIPHREWPFCNNPRCQSAQSYYDKEVSNLRT
jgi:hypothetical protein